MHIPQPNWLAKHMHAETICMQFCCQSICFTILPSVLERVHKTFIYRAEFLQYSQVVNDYVEVRDFVFQISFCDRSRRYKKLKTQAPNLKMIKVKEPLEVVGVDLISKLNS